MALGRYARIDGNSSSNYCFTISAVVFVSTCLLGAWMSVSSSMGPVRMGISLQQFMGFMPQNASRSEGHNHIPDDALKGNGSQGNVKDDSNHNMTVNENVPPKESQSSESDDKKDELKAEKEVKAERDQNAPAIIEESVGGDGDNNVQAQQSKDGADTSDQKVNMENSDGVLRKNDTDGKPEPKESANEVKQVGVPETSVDETGGYKDRIPIDEREILAPTIQDGVIDVREQSKDSIGDYSPTASEIGFKNRAEITNETSTQIAPSPTQSVVELEKGEDSRSFTLSKPDYRWKVCNVTAGPDYIPCLDNIQAIKKLRSTKHYEHRERHCPDEAPTCLVPLPKGYRIPIKWPKSREMIWFANVPHTRLAEYKRHQNWVKVFGRFLTFPGGGTQFKYGALHYIDTLQKTVPDIAWGKRSRVILDVGCGVASFGGFLFDRDVLAMSLAPKDEHEAQVQFALERGIPAISAVMGTKRLPFPSMVFDIVHCARCRVPWHIEGGKLLLELDRLLRPGGFFVWSATPVYRRNTEDVGIWKEMSKLTESMCWELVRVGRDDVNRKAAAFFRKPTSNDCYERRQDNNPPLCEESDDPNAAWYTPLQACIHKVQTDPYKRGSQWPIHWPSRLEKPPYWLKSSDELAPQKFIDDYNHWKHVVADLYLNGLGIDWSSVRNVMDMSASFGGFAAALRDFKVWVMNVVPVNSSNTLPIIYERGLIGIYHDWCESFSTYPRSYDLLHADHIFSDVKKRCKFVLVMAEVDRILRPEGWLIVRDDPQTINEVESIAKSLQWKIQFTRSQDNEGLLCVQKSKWRPSEVETVMSAIA